MKDILSHSDKNNERTHALAGERRNILELPPEKVLDAIAENPYPVSLIQSFSEEDFYFLVYQIGPDDALPILSLASNEQWEYLVDMEIWLRDRPDNMGLTRWLNRLLKADADRFTHWIINEQRDLLEYYLFQNLQVHIREYEQDPSEINEEFSTEDQVHYVRLRKAPPGNPKAEAFEEERDAFILDLLKRIAIFDLTLYQNILLESSIVISSEAEEELYRLRSIRMAEKGFLPFDEAIGVYQALSVADLLKRQHKPKGFAGRHVESYPLRVEPIHVDENANLFVHTLTSIRSERILMELQTEFAGLCNQVISADQMLIREKKELTHIVDKVSGYISLGLEKINADMPSQDPHSNANYLQSYLLADIFRIGYGCALALKWKAEKWLQNSWFSVTGLPLGFWGEEWLGVLGGVLLKKPLFFDNYATGVLYREFAEFQDITQTEANLDQIISIDHLLSQMSLDITRTSATGILTYANLLLTLWANHHLGLVDNPKTPQPLTIDQFRSFFPQLWENNVPPRRINYAVYEKCLNWFADRTGLTIYDITERVGSCMKKLFETIEKELGSVTLKNLDPRYIYIFLIKTIN